MRQTEKQKVSAGEIKETIKRKRRKESQSTIHRVKIGRMSRSEAILSHNAKEKEELEKKRRQLATAVRQKRCEVRPDLIREE